MMTSRENDLFLGLCNKTEKTKNIANTVPCSLLCCVVLWTALVELHLSSVNWFAFVQHVYDLYIGTIWAVY